MESKALVSPFPFPLHLWCYTVILSFFPPSPQHDSPIHSPTYHQETSESKRQCCPTQKKTPPKKPSPFRRCFLYFREKTMVNLDFTYISLFPLPLYWNPLAFNWNLLEFPCISLAYTSISLDSTGIGSHFTSLHYHFIGFHLQFTGFSRIPLHPTTGKLAKLAFYLHKPQSNCHETVMKLSWNLHKQNSDENKNPSKTIV